jgi:hypothetical protein
VVVLAGDAPAHADSEKKLLDLVREFCRDNQSFVHALITTPDAPPADVRSSFGRIAARGQGVCVGLGDQQKVMRSVLSLAFGGNFQRDIDKVYHLVEQRRHISTWALDLAHRGGQDLQEALLRTPVPDDLVRAMVERPRRRVIRQLVELAADPGTPETAREAAAFVVQKALDLALPPCSPERGGPTGATLAQELVRLTEQRLPD